MKLTDISALSPSQALVCEAMTSDMKQGLDYVRMMVTRQGKDGEAFVKDVISSLDPKAAANQKATTGLKTWLQSGKPGDSVQVKMMGRRVSVTIKEELINEALFGTKKDSNLVTQALKKYPELLSLLKYAEQSDKDLYSDDAFWSLVGRVTGGKNDDVKRLFDSLLQECIEESKISTVLKSLGLDANKIQGLLAQHQVEDQDYDVARLKEAPGKALEAGKSAVGKVADKVSGAVDQAKDAAGKVGEKAKGLFGAAKGKLGGIGSSLNSVFNARKTRQRNKALANAVIKAAAHVLDTAGAATGTKEPDSVSNTRQANFLKKQALASKLDTPKPEIKAQPEKEEPDLSSFGF